MIAGVLAIFGGFAATSGQISLPIPWSTDPITFDGTPIGIVLVVLGLAFYVLSRPQVRKVD